MYDIAARCMQGIGYNIRLFNIEFMYDAASDDMKIIEINPRMRSQFADIAQKVDGTNTYHYQLAIAVGQKPTTQFGCGKYHMALCFVLRIFSDKKVIYVPTDQDKMHVHRYFPDVRIYVTCQQGGYLSDERQDGASFRYGLIHVGGTSRNDLEKHFDRCQQLLPFVLCDV